MPHFAAPTDDAAFLSPVGVNVVFPAMRIHDRHQFHGAALIQIAEHPAFTAINAFRYGGTKSTNAYTINDNIGVYLKYATKSHGKYEEFVFTFAREHLEELAALKARQDQTFIALVCWSAKEVCAVPYKLLRSLVAEREQLSGAKEDSYTIYVRAPERASFRVYISPPGQKNRSLGESIISRNAFPADLFVKKGRAHA